MFENAAALIIAVEKECTPEVAFKYLDDGYIFNKKLTFEWTEQEVESLVKFRQSGLTYKEIADMYCVGASNIYRVLKRYKKRPFAEGQIKNSI